MSKIEYTREAVAKRLKDGKVQARIYKRGDRLWLQATLPPKPGSNREKPFQQRISLGLPANTDGYRRAEQEAKLLGGRLASGTFDWKDYMSLELIPEYKPVKNWVQDFKEHYLETHTLKDATWINQWQKIFKRLSPEERLTSQMLQSQVIKTARDTRDRMETCRKLQHLANFAGIEIDLLQYKGTYGPSQVEARDIPDDSEIAQVWNQIPNPSWQWAYGVMATFGLRDHELFFCEWTNDGLFVIKGKTGPRIVFVGLYEEWIDKWDLRTIKRPKVKNPHNDYEKGRLGTKVSRQFRRYKIPFSPYDLRHAFGIRASVTFALPVTTAAALMGHSPKIHLDRYHKHIKLKENQDVAQRILNRPDRLKPPFL
ncbi:MAG: hypothetical protein AAF703_12040 [Cyanobacteria bacterium P01_D01_bin.105]